MRFYLVDKIELGGLLQRPKVIMLYSIESYFVIKYLIGVELTMKFDLGPKS